VGRVRARGLRGNRVAATHGIREPPAVRLSNAHPGYAVLIGVARAVHENCGVSRRASRDYRTSGGSPLRDPNPVPGLDTRSSADACPRAQGRAGSEEGFDRESFKQTISRVRTDLRFHHTVEEPIAEGDTVVARLTGHGETGGESSGGERFTAAGVVIWKLHNGQMVERWAFWEPV
jgi:predicted ester cyclase